MATEIRLTEPYYKEFHKRLGVRFDEEEAVDVYTKTQTLKANWPNVPPPEVGFHKGLAYVKYDWPTCALRICFGYRDFNLSKQIVALTCRTKQELQRGNKNANREWYRHMETIGQARWDDYRRGLIKSWAIY